MKPHELIAELEGIAHEHNTCHATIMEEAKKVDCSKEDNNYDELITKAREHHLIFSACKYAIKNYDDWVNYTP